jgi:pimeloyl-ACP methyl ester carboxylesterase
MRLILLPGMDGTGILFEPFLAEWPRWIRPTVVRYPTDVRLDYPELLPIVRAACPATDDYVLLAESFSGPLAILFAAAAGPNLRGLVLVATFARSPVPKLLTLLANALVFRLTPTFLPRWFLLGHDGTPELNRLLDSALRQVKPHVLAARARAVGRVNVLDELRRLSLRVLILSASDDWIVGKSRTREMYEACPAAERFEVSGPHMILEASPRSCVKVVNDWAQSLVDR